MARLEGAYQAVDRLDDETPPAIPHVNRLQENTAEPVGAARTRHQGGWAAGLGRTVGDHPLAAVAAALALGLLVARLAR